MTHFTDVHLVVDNSAIVVVTVAAIAAIQSYWGNKTTETQAKLRKGVDTVKTNMANVQKDLETVKTDVSNMKDTIFTKEDLAHVVDEMGK